MGKKRTFKETAIFLDNLAKKELAEGKSKEQLQAEIKQALKEYEKTADNIGEWLEQFDIEL